MRSLLKKSRNHLVILGVMMSVKENRTLLRFERKFFKANTLKVQSQCGGKTFRKE